MAPQGNKPSLFSADNMVQITGLLFAIVVVWLAYIWIIRPHAEVIELENKVLAATQTDEAFVPKRNFYVIIKNYEQQICFTLMLWAVIMVFHKFYQVRREKQVLWEDFLDSIGTRVTTWAGGWRTGSPACGGCPPFTRRGARSVQAGISAVGPSKS